MVTNVLLVFIQQHSALCLALQQQALQLMCVLRLARHYRVKVCVRIKPCKQFTVSIDEQKRKLGIIFLPNFPTQSVCMHSKGLVLPRASHSGEIAQ